MSPTTIPTTWEDTVASMTLQGDLKIHCYLGGDGKY